MRRKAFKGGASTRSLVRLFEKMKENEKDEVDASIVSACLPSMALLIRAGWSGQSRSAKMKGENEEEDGGVERGESE